MSFLYRDVLDAPPDLVDRLVHARRPDRLPTVLSGAEIRAVFAHLDGTPGLVALLLYASGLRLTEAVTLRVKHVDAEGREPRIRDRKGGEDRITVLADSAVQRLRPHLEHCVACTRGAVTNGAGQVSLPGTLARKLTGAAQEWDWQTPLPTSVSFRAARVVSGLAPPGTLVDDP